jgi:hypothetical protein
MSKRHSDFLIDEISTVQPKKQRMCKFCSKNPVYVQDCKCGLSLCIPHMNTEHGCTFDYKAAQRALLEKQNPAIKTEKVPSF